MIALLYKSACGHHQQQKLCATCVMRTCERRELFLQTRAHNSQPGIGKGAHRAAACTAAERRHKRRSLNSNRHNVKELKSGITA